MKMPEKTIETAMFSPCGMNCKVCYKHCDSKTPCAGCFNNSSVKPKHCQKCKIKECLTSKPFTYCFECPDYPCQHINRLEKNYKRRYQTSLVDNSLFVKEHGLEEFMKRQKAIFTCPKCGGIISLHDRICTECKETVE